MSRFLALGQHHGLPTRLLDWTTDPLRAAYFAAVVGAEAAWTLTADSKDLDMDVWALRFGAYSAFHIVEAPRAGNAYLHAQEGLFTVINGNGTVRGCVLTEPLDEVVKNRVDSNETILRRFTLPKEEAWDLLELLEQFGISTATLFPSVDGAVRSLETGRFAAGIPIRTISLVPLTPK